MFFLSLSQIFGLLFFALIQPTVFSDQTTVSVGTAKPTPRNRLRQFRTKPPANPSSSRPSKRPAQRFRKKAMSFPGKKGASFVLRPGADQLAMFRIKLLRAYWNFSWGLPREPEQPSDVEFVPMVWGRTSTTNLVSRLNTVVVPYINNGQVKRLLAFNEPDQKGQADMSPAQAIEMWPYLEQLGIPLCSPSCGSPFTIANNTWMEDFMKEVAIRHYRVDYVGVHWYGPPNALVAQYFLKKVYDVYGRPLLITEFAVADWSASASKPNQFSARQVLTFMKAMLPWLEAQDWISGYVWFPFDVSSPVGGISALFDAAGNLTACGLYYQSVTTNNPSGDQSIGVAPTAAPTK